MCSKKRKVCAGAEVSPSPSIQAYIKKGGKLGGILTPTLHNLALNTFRGIKKYISNVFCKFKRIFDNIFTVLSVPPILLERKR
jgi:hypothetical protein